MREPSSAIDWRGLLAAYPSPAAWVPIEELLARGVVDGEVLPYLLRLTPALGPETRAIQLGDFILRLHRFANVVESLCPGMRAATHRELRFGSD